MQTTGCAVLDPSTSTCRRLGVRRGSGAGGGVAAVVAAPSYGRTSTYGPSSEPGSSGSASGPAYSAAASPSAAT